MKLAAKLGKLKRQKQPAQPTPGLSQPKRTKLSVRWAWVAVGLLLVGGGTWAVLHFIVWNQLPAELVGQWEVTEGPMARGTFRFSRNGAVEIRARDQALDYAVKGHVVLDNKTLLTTTKNPQTGQEQTRKSTIQELAANSLILELEGGGVLRLQRRQ